MPVAGALALGIERLTDEAATVLVTILAGFALVLLIRYGLRFLMERLLFAGLASFERTTGDESRRMTRRARTLESFTVRTSESVVVIVTLMAVLAQLGVRVEALLASAGLAGVAIAFGAQAIVRDSISGLFILAQGPFDLGDFVRLNAVEGTVAQISLRSTTLVSDEGVIHTVANGSITQTTNYTRDSWSHTLVLRVKREVPVERVQQAVDELAAELALAPELGDELVSGPAVRGVVGIRGGSYDVEVRTVMRPELRMRWPALVHSQLARSLERHDVALD